MSRNFIKLVLSCQLKANQCIALTRALYTTGAHVDMSHELHTKYKQKWYKSNMFQSTRNAKNTTQLFVLLWVIHRQALYSRHGTHRPTHASKNRKKNVGCKSFKVKNDKSLKTSNPCNFYLDDSINSINTHTLSRIRKHCVWSCKNSKISLR